MRGRGHGQRHHRRAPGLNPLKLILAVVAFAAILRMGMAVLRAFARPIGTPEAGELRKVNLRYRCGVCGAVVRMVQAAEELPPPPRHCQEEMDLVAPLYE